MQKPFIVTLLAVVTLPIVIYAVGLTKQWYTHAEDRCFTSEGWRECSRTYEDLFAGQGRNMRAYGYDELSFVARARKLEISLEGKLIKIREISDIDNRLRQVYSKSVAKNVNPLLVLSLWGEETAFSTTAKYPLGCGVYTDDPDYFGFYNNVDCAVATLNNEMFRFEVLKEMYPLPIKLFDTRTGRQTCEYRDPVFFALEIYGPVCTADDSNDHFHVNLHMIYTAFLRITPPRTAD